MTKRNAIDCETDDLEKKKVKLDSSKMFIGAHVSIKGGLHEAFHAATKIGAKAFACFLRNQRRWDFNPLSETIINNFLKTAKESEIKMDHVVPHSSFLLNCGSPNEEILNKSRKLLTIELQSCDKLGIKYYNIHPGSTCGKCSIKESIKLISESLNLALSQSENVTVLLENMSCQGNTVGGKFEELAEIINGVDNKDRVGVCIDTCHAFAAGFPIETDKGFEEMFDKFDRIIGLNKLKAFHINDSKGPCGNHLDRHENIGQGKIGKRLFRNIVNDPRFVNIPMILEIPDVEKYSEQIKMLYEMMEN